METASIARDKRPQQLYTDMLHLLLIAVILPILSVPTLGAPEDGYKRMCYFTNWAQYRPGRGQQMAAHLRPEFCTHIVFAFAGIADNQLKKTEWNDDTSYKAVVALKKNRPDLKVLLSVGGANDEVLQEMRNMILAPSSRQTFINSCLSVLLRYDFDGIDLDFEFPGKDDRNPFSLLLEEMMRAFVDEANASNRTRLLIAIAVPTSPALIHDGYDAAVLRANTDFVLLLTYDYHGAWETITGHHSALYEPDAYGPFGTTTNMNYGATYWARLGIPREMLIVGMALYGRGFHLVDDRKSDVGSPAMGASAKQQYTVTEGTIAFYEVCDLISQGGKTYWSEEMQVPYLVYHNSWFGYDDTRSLRNKVKWLKKLGFGGYLVWDMSLDDIGGNFCAMGPYPLLEALSDEVLSNSTDPLPPPSYLSEFKCGPCVNKSSTNGTTPTTIVRDCDQENPSLYHQCYDGLITFTASCADVAASPFFSVQDQGCIAKSALNSQAACNTTLLCGWSPESAILAEAGYPRAVANITEVATPTPTDGTVSDSSTKLQAAALQLALLASVLISIR